MLSDYSGLMYTDNYAVRRLPEIVTTSGYALIHFYSDIAVNMSGFNISYRYVITSPVQLMLIV